MTRTPPPRDPPHPALLAPKPDGRYSKTATDRSIDSLLAAYIADTLAETTDEWDEITATETPTAMASEPNGKRSGVYWREATDGEKLQALRVRCSGGDP